MEKKTGRKASAWAEYDGREEMNLNVVWLVIFSSFFKSFSTK